MALRIVIETIPHEKQRYETVGDWWYGPDATINIAVSDLGDWKKEALVAIHELSEVILCRAKGISQTEVDNFDIEFEARREAGNVDEPGDAKLAPYRNEHCFATAVERMLCAALGLSWKEYDDAVNGLHLD